MRRNCSVLVTGAGGFLGTSVCRALDASGHRITGLDIAPQPESWRWEWLQAPIDDLPAYESALPGIDAVIHAAWTGFPGAPIAFQRDFERDVGPTLKFYLRCCELNVGRFVFLSSGGTIYGNPDHLPIPENAPLRPISLYGASKVTAEVYLGMLGHMTGKPATVLRIANPFGPGQMPWRGQGVVATAIACALTGAEFQVWGSGDATRDYVFIDDVAEAIATAALAPGPSATYNVGSGIGVSLNEVIATVEAATGRQLSLLRYPDRKVDVNANVLSVDKIRAELNWKPSVPFLEGVRRSHDWLAEHRSSWSNAKPD